MTPPPLISARELAALLDPRVSALLAPSVAGRTEFRPVVFDASYLLERPEFDGDYRSGSAFERWRAGHIPGSRYVDLQEQFSVRGKSHFTHPAAEAVAAELARLGVSATRPVVVYDTTNTIFAARLWYLLDWIGVDARVLDGGLDSWRAAGLPVESGAAVAATSVPAWTPARVRDAWIEIDEIAGRSADDSRPLICALPEATFTGNETTRYSRRGHIPGSINVPARSLFTESGMMRPTDQVAQRFAGIDGVDGVGGRVGGATAEAAAAQVLLYCGGGISASASALALATIGVRTVRIYDGSLEEWSADDSLPLETARS